MTLGEKYEAAEGRPAGFDYIRLFLAISVVCFHTIPITYGSDFAYQVWVAPEYRVLIVGILPAFFALSGFLVAGSLARCKTLPGFLFLRAIRIFPALIVEVVLSALLLGPAMTAFTWPEYLSDPELYRYFLNCIGDIHFTLPGLFLQNPQPGLVNAQLWTVPFELECYITLSLLTAIGIVRHHRLFSALIVAMVGYTILRYFTNPLYANLSLSGRALVLCFLTGVLFYNLRASIPYSRWLALAAVAASLVFFWIPGGGALSAIPVTYVTVFLGITNPRRLAFIRRGDYSYGIFLYAYPVQQAVVATRLLPLNGFVTLAVAFPLIFAVAACSWHFWEKRMLELRRFRPAVDRFFSFIPPGAVELLAFSGWRRFKQVAAARGRGTR